MRSDHDLFNCSEQYEIDYVANLYTKPAEVKAALITMCTNNELKNATHAEVYKKLAAKGFVKK